MQVSRAAGRSPAWSLARISTTQSSFHLARAAGALGTFLKLGVEPLQGDLSGAELGTWQGVAPRSGDAPGLGLHQAPPSSRDDAADCRCRHRELVRRGHRRTDLRVLRSVVSPVPGRPRIRRVLEMRAVTSEGTPLNASTSGPLMSSTLTDGVVTLRGSTASDIPDLLAGRDDQRRRFLGVGSDEPQPSFCIIVEGEVAGWVDHDCDADHPWLGVGEVNVGYELSPPSAGAVSPPARSDSCSITLPCVGNIR